MKKNITALDIESSGFHGYPIQIGVIKENGLTYESLIKPEKKWLKDLEWNYDSQNIHNIEKEYIIKNGKSAISVANNLNDFIGEEDVFVDSQYDIIWISLLFEAAKIKRKFKIFVLYKILPTDFMIHWDAIFNIEQKKSKLRLHDALSDAKLIQKTFITIAKHF